MQKRFLSLFIALAMICSLFVFPASVFADMIGVSGNGEVCTLYKGDVKVDAVSGTITLKFNSDVDSDTILSILVYDDEKLQELGNEIAGLTGTVPGLYGDYNYEPAMVYHSIKDYDDTATVFIPNAQENVFSIPIPQASWNRKLIVLSSSDKSAGVSAYFVTLDENGNLMPPSGTIKLSLDGGTLEGYVASKGISVPAGEYTKDELLAAIGTPTKANYKFKEWTELDTAFTKNGEKYVVAEQEYSLTATYDKKLDFSGSLSISANSEFNGNPQKPTINGLNGAEISTWYFDGTAGNGPTNVGTYQVSVKIKEGTDYAETDNVSVGQWQITPATYTVSGNPTVSVNHGDSLEVTKANAGVGGLAIVKDVKGNAVAGNIVINSGSTNKADEASSPYTNQNWTFTAAATDSNYTSNTASGTNATINVNSRTAVTPTFTGSSSTYDGSAIEEGAGKDISVAFTGGTVGTNYEMQFKNAATGGSADTAFNDWTTTKPTHAGRYDVKVVLKGAAATSYKLADGTGTSTFVINPKKVALNAITFEKTYDGNTTAKKADGSEYAIADLTLADNTITGVNIVADGTFAATYDSADAANSVGVTISGVKLDNANYEIDGDSLKMSGKINPVAIKATLKDANAKKTYGTAITLDLATNFDITGTFVGADDVNLLADATLSCNGLAEGAAVVDGGYAVTAATQPTNTNYTLTVDGTLTVEPKEISIAADAKTGLKYKGSAYAPADTVDVTPTGLVGTDTVSYKYTVAEGDILHPGTYNVTVALADDVKNYKLAANATAAVVIAKADYIVDTPFGDAHTVVADSNIVGEEFAATVTGADGNKVSGKYVITATNPAGPAVAGTEYTVDWKFVADTPNATDYNDLTGTNKVTGTDEGSKLAITYAKGHYDGTEPTTDGFITEVTKGDKLDVTGYKFGNVGDYKQVGWYDAAGNLVTGEVTIDADTTFTAAWEYKISVVEMKKDGTAKDPVEVTFTDSYASVPTASAINISADAADTGYEFTGWSQEIAADANGITDGTFAAATDLATTYTPAASAAYPISGTVTLKPTYAAKKYSITATAPTNGTYVVKVDGVEVTPVDNVIADVPYGSSIEVVPTPDEANGYTSSSVKVTDSAGTVKVENNGFKMPADNATITVTFSKPSRPSHSGGGGGTTYFDVKYDAGTNGTITSGNASERVAFGSKPKNVPTITANDGYRFVGWSLDGTTTVDPTAQSVNKALTFTALYTDGSAPVQTPGPVTETDSHSAYVYGYPDGTFQAENGITRAETAAIFARALTDYVEGSAYTGNYNDVADDWYTNYVNFLSGRGVITGYEDGSFRPDNNITRREFTAMITRLGEVLEANGAGFPDVEDTDWAVNNIYTAAASGLVNGYEDGTFRPDNNITRAEAVKIVNAYLGRGVNEAGLANADYTTFPDVTTAHWAYYEIIEAANDHTFAEGTKPEVWTR